jgi:predicted  nucleic acid-binding Zn-ribbon protein
MENLINMLNKLSLDNDESKEIDTLCNKINSIKISTEKEEIKEELIGKVIYNFFEILSKKGRCVVQIKNENIRWLY